MSGLPPVGSNNNNYKTNLEDDTSTYHSIGSIDHEAKPTRVNPQDVNRLNAAHDVAMESVDKWNQDLSKVVKVAYVALVEFQRLALEVQGKGLQEMHDADKDVYSPLNTQRATLVNQAKKLCCTRGAYEKLPCVPERAEIPDCYEKIQELFVQILLALDTFPQLKARCTVDELHAEQKAYADLIEPLFAANLDRHTASTRLLEPVNKVIKLYLTFVDPNIEQRPSQGYANMLAEIRGKRPTSDDQDAMAALEARRMLHLFMLQVSKYILQKYVSEEDMMITTLNGLIAHAKGDVQDAPLVSAEEVHATTMDAFKERKKSEFSFTGRLTFGEKAWYRAGQYGPTGVVAGVIDGDVAQALSGLLVFVKMHLQDKCVGRLEALSVRDAVNEVVKLYIKFVDPVLETFQEQGLEPLVQQLQTTHVKAVVDVEPRKAFFLTMLHRCKRLVVVDDRKDLQPLVDALIDHAQGYVATGVQALAGNGDDERELLKELEQSRAAFLHNCILDLEKKLDEKLAEFCGEPHNDLTPHLLSYTFVLKMAVQEARSVLACGKKVLHSSGLQVLKELGQISRYYRQVQEMSDLDNVLELCHSASNVKNIPRGAKQPSHVDKDDEAPPTFDDLMARTLEFLSQTHLVDAKNVVELVGAEETVPMAILGGFSDPFGANNLVEPIMTYIAKRILRYGVVPGDAYESLFEMVLYTLRTKYKEQFEASLQDKAYYKIGAILESYDKAYGVKRLSDEALKKACRVAKQAYLVRKTDDIAPYLQGWQRCFEFFPQSQDPHVDAMKEKLVTLLEQERPKRFTPLYPSVQENTLKSWNTSEHNAFMELLKEKCKTDYEHLLDVEQEKAMFTSLLTRFLGASLHAKDPIVDVEAQEGLVWLLRNIRCWGYIDALPDELKHAICNNVMNKAISSSQVGALVLKLETKEEEFILAEAFCPFTDLLRLPYIKAERTPNQTALYVLLTQNSLTPAGREKLLDRCAWKDKYDEWVAGFRTLLQTNPYRKV